MRMDLRADRPGGEIDGAAWSFACYGESEMLLDGVPGMVEPGLEGERVCGGG